MTQVNDLKPTQWLEMIFYVQVQGNEMTTSDQFARTFMKPSIYLFGGRVVETIKFDSKEWRFSSPITRDRDWLDVAYIIVFIVPGLILGIYVKYRQIKALGPEQRRAIYDKNIDVLRTYNGASKDFEACLRIYSFPSEVKAIARRDKNAVELALKMRPIFPSLGFIEFPEKITLDNDTQTWLRDNHIVIRYNNIDLFVDEYLKTISDDANA